MSVGTEQIHGSQRNQTVGSAGNRAGSVHVQGKGPFTHREERRIFLQKIRQQREQRIHLQCGRFGFDPWVGKIPWMRAWQPTPVFLPGESYRQRSLAGYKSMVLQRV